MNKIKSFLGACLLSFVPFGAMSSNVVEHSTFEIEKEDQSKTDKAWEKQLDNVLKTSNTYKKLSLIGYNYHKEIASLRVFLLEKYPKEIIDSLNDISRYKIEDLEDILADVDQALEKI